ncbi:unnamed protein product [Fusarium graminearum]|uniref:Uncharacterized protein n=1 Tax=Fusarium culmorum TaxID=5516 RepID=A0A2T4GY15_FUSCU|nr:hypothetical protein FCULG_00006679 [Fusarium culmorum]CAF3511601.1 unnamed protein product [Fusarium graminearum]CAG2006256.1 unnamed protein product [Fusarium graminearum]
MPSWSMRVTGSWKQENLGQQLDQRQWDANSTLVPRKWKRYKSENTKVKATQRIKTPLVENQLDTIVIRQIRTVKRAPKYESKVQQVLQLEVAMKGEKGE